MSWVPPQVTQLFDMAIGEYGQDYAVPVGTPIYSPVAGTFATEDLGKAAWGKRAFVHATSGLSFAVGHLSSFAASSGQQIKVGDLIGYSGGALSDPSSGNSTGPHVETQFFTAAGKYLDPRTVFAQFTSWEQAIFTGKGAAGGSNATQPSSSSSSTQDLVAGLPFGLSGAGALLVRAFWIVAGVGAFLFGLVLVFSGDIETVIEKGQDATEKAGKVAATVAAPEVAVPAEAAGAAA